MIECAPQQVLASRSKLLNASRFRRHADKRRTASVNYGGRQLARFTAHGYFRLPLESMVMPPGPAVLLLFVGLASTHCLGAPVLCGCDVCLDRRGIAVVHIGLAAVNQVQIGHGIVIVGPVGHRLD